MTFKRVGVTHYPQTGMQDHSQTLDACHDHTENEAAGEKNKRKWEDEQQNRERDIPGAEKQTRVAATPMDVITLNVGGRLFTTIRATLCQIDGSLLASMFSGRWGESSLNRDEKNHVFLDMDPDCFEFIMKWLRILRIDPGTEFPTIPDKMAIEMGKWRNYFGLAPPIPDFNWRTTDTDHFEVCGKTVKRIGGSSGFYSVRIGPVWNQLADIPSEIEFVCAGWTDRDGDDATCYEGHPVNFGNSFKFGFRSMTDARTRKDPRLIGTGQSDPWAICLKSISPGDRVTINVRHKTCSVKLNGNLIRGGLPLTEPCELVLRLPRVGQSLTLL